MFRAARWRIRLWSPTSSLIERHVRDGALDEAGARGDGVGLAGEQVVEHRHARAGVHEAPSHGGSDEPGAAGHEDSASTEGALDRTVRHRFIPVLSRRAGRNSRHQSLRPRIFE